MKYRRGDVVTLDHPFSDATGSEVRPAVIVQADSRNAVLTNTVVALITKNLQRVGTDATQLFIGLATADGKRSGLRVNSAVTCGNLFTVHETLIHKKIGRLSVTLMRQVDDCLKVALDIV